MEKTRICPCCKQEVQIQVGFHNWKKLFRKPTIEELITLFIIIMTILLYFAWQHDIGQYQKYIAENCNKGLDIKNNLNSDSDSLIKPMINISQNDTIEEEPNQ